MKIVRFKTFLLEGGNVFDNTDKIPKDFIEPTLNQFFLALKSIFPKQKSLFTTSTFKPLGSVGKKDYSGDIDLAIDSKVLIKDKNFSKEFLNSWNIDEKEFNSTFETVKKRSKTSTVEMNKEKAFLILLAKAMNKSGLIQAHEKKVTNGNIFTNFPQYNEKNKKQEVSVQIDFMIGNLDWLMFSYYSDVYKDNVKGLHRTQLMLAMFSAKGKIFNHVNGVKDKDTGKVEATNPKEALDILNQLYKTKITEEILQNYFKLSEYIEKHLNQKDLFKIYDIYLKILDSTRADIPNNLQDYWLKNKDRLNLTGKFLPDDSKLKQHLTESGVVQPDRIERKDLDATLRNYNKQVLSKISEVKSYKLSGSVNSNLKKQDFGDIDLIVLIEAKDKTVAKQLLIQEFESNKYIIPFEYKGRTKKYYNAGELITVKFKQANSDKTVQIDNIISLTKEEYNFKQKFLDLPAEKQGLILGLVKVAVSEFPEKHKDFKDLDYDLSSVSLRVRDNMNTVFKSTQDWNEVEKILSLYGLDYNDSFEQYINKIKTLSRRSIDRIKGLFKKMITVKSGEVGTEKGNKKEEVLELVNSL